MKVPNGVTRRRVLLGTTTAVTAGVGLGVAGTQSASANVTAEGISIPDAEHRSKSGEVSDVTLSVSGSYNFEVENADEYTLALYIAHDGADYQRLDRIEETALSSSMGSSYELSGSILSHDDWAASAFSANPEETTTVDVPVRVTLTVMFDGSEVVSTDAETTATIDVTNTSVKATGTIGGEGSVSFETPA